MTKKRAFSLAEVFLTLAIVGILIGLVSGRVLRQMPDIEKTRIKKAYLVVEKTVFSLVNNDVLYPGNKIMRNLESVTTTVGDQFGVANKLTKFRDAFMYYVDIAEENLSCDVFSVGKIDKCFKTTDGIVFGIPDTDFERSGVVAVTDAAPAYAEDYARAFVPITIYPSWKSKKDLNSSAIVIGVRFDGKIQVLNTVGCTETSAELRCKLEEMLQSDDIKKNN